MSDSPEETDAPSPFCALCGQPMAADQEWCLECGAGRTVVVPAPDWRIPLVVIGVIVVLVIGGFVYAITRLGSDAGKVTVVSSPAVGARAGTGTVAGATPGLASWQPGLDGWTVVLATAPSRSAADTGARAFTARLAGVGVLDTSQHPEMVGPGVWDIFAGRYSSYALARVAASHAAHSGETGARPALVQRPGGVY